MNSLFETAKQCSPGGVHSPVRAFGSVPGDPVFFARGEGAYVETADGRRLLDLCMSWGPLIMGHAHPAVVEAVQTAATRGLSFGACHQAETVLATKLLKGFAWADQVRFTSSGTEAVMTAVRLIRGISGRDKVIKFDGGYHGHFDSMLVKAGSGLATSGLASSAGVPAGSAADTIVLPFDDLEALEVAFDEFAGEIAGVVLEPVPGNNGLLLQRPEWLKRLRALCDEHCALLVFDEVISGFRSCYGGVDGALGIQPDLTTLGKIIGGGMPIGAIVGSRGFMEKLAPTGPVYQAGTLSGNPVSVAAGIATLDLLSDPAVYERLDALGAYLEDALLERAGVRTVRAGSLLWPYLGEDAFPRRADQIEALHAERFKPLHAHLLASGFYLPPSAYEVLFLSHAHTEPALDALVDAWIEGASS